MDARSHGKSRKLMRSRHNAFSVSLGSLSPEASAALVQADF
jgi:hypothetical protein